MLPSFLRSFIADTYHPDILDVKEAVIVKDTRPDPSLVEHPPLTALIEWMRMLP
jgi:hypothetical protein